MQNMKVALITGAAGGMGCATAITLAARGYRIAAIDQSGTQLSALAGRIESAGGICLPLEADVTDAADVEESVSRVVETFGGVDVLATFAGIIRMRRLVNTSLEEFDQMINVNLRGTFLMMKAVIPHMIRQESGVIVTVASVSAHKGYAYHAAYSASKAGVLRLTEAAADELRSHNIRAVAVCPSGVATDLFGEKMRELDRSKWLQPQDIADLVAYLVSNEARGITGVCVDIRGLHVVSVDEVRPYLDLGEED